MLSCKAFLQYVCTVCVYVCMHRIAGGYTREQECTCEGVRAKIDRRMTEVAVANTNVMESYF